jgi:hypothetical protein
MSYQSAAYDKQNDDGFPPDPVVVIVATGTHDVSRLAHLLNGGAPVIEQYQLGERVRRQVRRHSAGRAALHLLHEHGGPDLLETAPPKDAELEKLIRLAISDPGAFVKRGHPTAGGKSDYSESIPAWGARAVLVALERHGVDRAVATSGGAA